MNPMDPFLRKLQSITTIEKALEELKSQITLTQKLQEIIDFCIKIPNYITQSFNKLF